MGDNHKFFLKICIYYDPDSIMFDFTSLCRNVNPSKLTNTQLSIHPKFHMHSSDHKKKTKAQQICVNRFNQNEQKKKQNWKEIKPRTGDEMSGFVACSGCLRDKKTQTERGYEVAELWRGTVWILGWARQNFGC